MGSSSRREPDDDGVLVVLAGVTPTQGAEESSVQGEGEQVVNLSGERLRGREMHKSSLIPHVQGNATGEPDAFNGARPVRQRGGEKRTELSVPR
jgi:hypothetical protein